MQGVRSEGRDQRADADVVEVETGSGFVEVTDPGQPAGATDDGLSSSRSQHTDPCPRSCGARGAGAARLDGGPTTLLYFRAISLIMAAMPSMVPVLDLSDLSSLTTSRADLEELLATAPLYEGDIRPVISRVIAMIHGLPDLYRGNISLSDIQIYLGRSTTKTLLQRYKYSASKHQHVGAAVVCLCSPDIVGFIELIGIRIITALKERGALCVGNVNIKNALAGNTADREDGGVVYMTWGRLRGDIRFKAKPTTSIIRDVARDVSSETLIRNNVFVPHEDIEDGLMIAKALTTRLALGFINY